MLTEIVVPPKRETNEFIQLFRIIQQHLTFYARAHSAQAWRRHEPPASIKIENQTYNKQNNKINSFETTHHIPLTLRIICTEYWGTGCYIRCLA